MNEWSNDTGSSARPASGQVDGDARIEPLLRLLLMLLMIAKRCEQIKANE